MNKHLKCFLKLLVLPLVVSYLIVTTIFVITPAIFMGISGCMDDDKLMELIWRPLDWFNNL